MLLMVLPMLLVLVMPMLLVLSLLLEEKRKLPIQQPGMLLPKARVVKCRQNQALEQDSLTMFEERTQLQNQADTLSERLEAVLHDKFAPRSGSSFDADTPIDKTLNMLQSIISVSASMNQRL